MKRIVCLDFDGVIHSYTSGWKGARNIPDPPIDGALEFIDAVLSAGYDVVICSSRARYWGGIRAMRAWLKDQSGNMWYECMGHRGIEDVKFTRHKPPAHLTIDDRAIQFKGQWPNLGEVYDFKPWRPCQKEMNR